MSSTECAITSRLTSDAFIPACPIAMPSVTEIVVNSRAVPPADPTPALAASAWRRSAMLHGAASFQVETTPTNGYPICRGVSPIACRKARCGARAAPTVV